jgi:hypothetical protein
MYCSNIDTPIYRFAPSYILAMLQDILIDYRDLRNNRLRVNIYELTKSYTLHIHEAKIELLADLLGQSFEKIKKKFQVPDVVTYKLAVEDAFNLLSQLAFEKQKLDSLIEQNKGVCEELRLNNYKITAKLFLLNYILGVSYKSFDPDNLLINQKVNFI